MNSAKFKRTLTSRGALIAFSSSFSVSFVLFIISTLTNIFGIVLTTNHNSGLSVTGGTNPYSRTIAYYPHLLSVALLLLTLLLLLFLMASVYYLKKSPGKSH